MQSRSGITGKWRKPYGRIGVFSYSRDHQFSAESNDRDLRSPYSDARTVHKPTWRTNTRHINITICFLVFVYAGKSTQNTRSSNPLILCLNSDNSFPHTSPHLSRRGRSKVTEKAAKLTSCIDRWEQDRSGHVGTVRSHR
jgi:hypothetical protein